ncbi:redoxin family protein [Leucobacter sp. CSA1]|uniref:Redoxin family protein n=1 Tax=Leucobacter chromiisoli TaxID=2796471 RepID=A0A934QB26_9MICO|nr:MerR family DNA-binding transcriptional regulator [Leucobacter chromiisoli]MBK0419827.1 redoxin family protein [Leucobacter chromiisoli]
MRIGELAARAGVSVKAVRYYERIGLIAPGRSENGYREFEERHVRAVREIRELSGLGIAPSRAAPFIDCLDAGHEHSDECVSSLVAYRDTIAELDRVIASLTAHREALQERLEQSAARPAEATGPTACADHDHSTERPDSTARTERAGSTAHTRPERKSPVTDYTRLPDDLPVPEDDGAAAHLPGLEMPPVELPTSDGGTADLANLGPGRAVIYLYPLTGRPGVDLPEGWDSIPGARGCSTEACDFRDHFTELQSAGVQAVYGMSSQDPAYQAEVVERLHLPFTMISDESFALGDALRLPTFAAPGHDRLYSRLTLVVRDGRVEHAFYPIFPPNTHAQQVLAWLEAHPAAA